MGRLALSATPWRAGIWQREARSHWQGIPYMICILCKDVQCASLTHHRAGAHDPRLFWVFGKTLSKLSVGNGRQVRDAHPLRREMCVNVIVMLIQHSKEIQLQKIQGKAIGRL
ncbi:uncharacterized protein MCYG_00406 [Microsporum canis CBS 113480]|uniref:Uncharacterized protein n=1 Tax=Arthroderma otae (strain ATCC MYA-4605 / CBS 113480) TaxID=554155 RepID=C5FC95_ARTOC|nr:uncharacterized protein MCYG_00406 [Microsporum canis CBS 113480]EEQ27518.1 predicted protein [Microsporum canis CBS 113480]